MGGEYCWPASWGERQQQAGCLTPTAESAPPRLIDVQPTPEKHQACCCNGKQPHCWCDKPQRGRCLLHGQALKGRPTQPHPNFIRHNDRSSRQLSRMTPSIGRHSYGIPCLAMLRCGGSSRCRPALTQGPRCVEPCGCEAHCKGNARALKARPGGGAPPNQGAGDLAAHRPLPAQITLPTVNH